VRDHPQPLRTRARTCSNATTSKRDAPKPSEEKTDGKSERQMAIADLQTGGNVMEEAKAYNSRWVRQNR
jgi:hypothetical protein